MQATKRGEQVGIPVGGSVNVKDVTESTEGEQEVMGMGAGKGASLWAAFEIVFLPRNKFKETRFQERLKAYTHCLANEQTFIEHQSHRKAVFS
ncbi:hypothetical protein [Paenibacillus contaminans]|nr:hypothetical protein [Paenibacillus contaminans]